MNPQPAGAVVPPVGPPPALLRAWSPAARSPWRRAATALVGLLLTVWVAREVGPTAVLDGLSQVGPASVLAAVVLGAVATAACAWRWALVAAALGLAVPLRSGVAASYRAQFLNSTLPGGIAGDVHRGAVHGRASGDLGRGLRVVGWERALGQCVQVIIVCLSLLALPSDLGPALSGAAVLTLGGLVLAAVVLHTNPRGWVTKVRGLPTLHADLQALTARPRTLLGILLASMVVVAAHAITFLIAARAVGVTVQPVTALQLALVVLLAMAVPVNLAGFGPREGAAAWTFAAVGAGAAMGVVAAVAFAALSMAATLPGALVLLHGRLRARPGLGAGDG